MQNVIGQELIEKAWNIIFPSIEKLFQYIDDGKSKRIALEVYGLHMTFPKFEANLDLELELEERLRINSSGTTFLGEGQVPVIHNGMVYFRPFRIVGGYGGISGRLAKHIAGEFIRTIEILSNMRAREDENVENMNLAVLL
ncbi:MAG: hypothetical protein HZB44_08490 [Actinobacteria bacterium]|nr:hypothetical protein [Actinomycetota bacterium]